MERPPLPKPFMRNWINAPFEDVELFTAEQLRAYGDAREAAALEAAAKVCERVCVRTPVSAGVGQACAAAIRALKSDVSIPAAKSNVSAGRVAPWTDFAGSAIYEGDTIEHPSGDRGRVVRLAGQLHEIDRWRVDYGHGDISRLGLQIGDKGRAVVVKSGAGSEGGEKG